MTDRQVTGDGEARPQKRVALTWWRGPFATATPGSAHMDPAARRLKTALLVAFDTAAAAVIPEERRSRCQRHRALRC